MADETTYDSEMNQPSHRPGMESVVNRGDARDSSGNRTSDTRPTVAAGKVDPFSIKDDPAPTPPAKTPPAAADDGSGTGGRQREQVISGQVDKAVTG